MNFKAKVTAAGGNVTAEDLLLEVATRLASASDITLTPRRVAQIIGGVLHDVDDARKRLEARDGSE